MRRILRGKIAWVGIKRIEDRNTRQPGAVSPDQFMLIGRHAEEVVQDLLGNSPMRQRLQIKGRRSEKQKPVNPVSKRRSRFLSLSRGPLILTAYWMDRVILLE